MSNAYKSDFTCLLFRVKHYQHSEKWWVFSGQRNLACCHCEWSQCYSRSHLTTKWRRADGLVFRIETQHSQTHNLGIGLGVGMSLSDTR